MFWFHLIYMIGIFIAYPFILVIFLISSFFNKNVREGHFYRLGFKRPPKIYGQTIWIHAASIGEVVSVKEIINILIDRKYTIYLSTTTATGYDIAKKIYPKNVIVFYNSLDLSILVKRLIKIISPEYLLIVEIELWPSLLYEASKKCIPIYLINGRIGKKELKGYSKAKVFFKNYYALYRKIFAQSETDRKNMLTIGMPKELITINGNIKYDVEYKLMEEKYNAIKNIPPKKKFIIVAGSTHDGEEKAILNAINNIKDKVYIVIVPRNIDRSKDIMEMSTSLGYNLSLFTQKGNYTENGIIINVIGELLYWYKRSDLVIMGGSFSSNIGGHNILEAIYFKKTVIVGPHIDNFYDMYMYMKETLLNCSSIEELEKTIEDIYKNKDLRENLGVLANKLLLENRGASAKTISTIDILQGKNL